MRNWKELLVVIITGALLCGVGAMQLQNASAEWKQARCKNNLMKLQQAAAAYQNDHDGAFQPVIVRTKPRWTFWYSFVLPYVDNPIIMYCPAHLRSQRILSEDLGVADLVPPVFDQGSLTYGMNYALSSSGTETEEKHPANINAIADLAYTIYFGDCKMPTPSLRATKWCWKDDYAPVHEGKANYVFLDGHVEAMNQDNLGLVHAFDGWKEDTKRWSNWKTKPAAAPEKAAK